MEDKNISPEESLKVIERMLADSRNKFYNNGFAFLFWGVLIILACIAQYVMIEMGYAHQSNYVWPIVVIMGIVVTFFYFRFQATTGQRAFSRLDSNNGMIWIAFAITYMVVIFLCVKMNIYPVGFIWCLLGFGMFASGGIYRFKPLYFGAIVFWIGAIVTVYLGNDTSELLICALIMFIGYIIPGYLLWRKAKKETNV